MLSSPSYLEQLIKVIIIGDATVGKTSFVIRYVSNHKPGNYKMTVGVDFSVKLIRWSDDQGLRVQLWDIGGQDRFHSLLRVYYKETHACVIVFDLSSRDTFLNALKWKQSVDQQCRLPDDSPVPCILLANKCDLKERVVEEEEIQQFCQENDFIAWRAVSAKTGQGVEDAMKFLLTRVMETNAESVTWDGAMEVDKITLRKASSASEASDTMDKSNSCAC